MTRHRAGALAVVALLLACITLSRPAHAGDDGERVSITATDGVQLVGHLYGTRGPGIVLGHMYPADQTSWTATARDLAAAGYRALTVDFRGYGESGGTKEISQIDRDMEGAYRTLVGRKIQPVFVAGASMGGTAALIVAARVPVAGVITLSAPVEFRGLDASTAVKNVHARKLFVAAEGDAPAAQAVARFAESAPDPKTTKLFGGDQHGTNLLTGPHGTEVRDLIRGFLAAEH